MNKPHTIRQISEKLTPPGSGRPTFDPYGTIAMQERARLLRAQSGDILAQAEREVAEGRSPMSEQTPFAMKIAMTAQELAELDKAISSAVTYDELQQLLDKRSKLTVELLELQGLVAKEVIDTTSTQASTSLEDASIKAENSLTDPKDLEVIKKATNHIKTSGYLSTAISMIRDNASSKVAAQKMREVLDCILLEKATNDIKAGGYLSGAISMISNNASSKVAAQKMREVLGLIV